jgi:hypothetical protein
MNKEFNRMLKLAGLMTEGLYTSDEKAPMEAMSSNKMSKKKLKDKIREMMLPEETPEEMAYAKMGNLDEAAPINMVTTMDGNTVVGTHQYGVGFKSNEIGKSKGLQDHPTSIPNGTKIARDGMGNMDEYDTQGLTNAASVVDHYLKTAYDAGAAGMGFDDNLAYEMMDHLKQFSGEMGGMEEDLFEAKKDEESDTEEVIVADTEEVPAEGGDDVAVNDTQVDVNMDGVPDLDTGSPEFKKAFTTLIDAYNAGKPVGDPKYTQMLANTVTYFNKNMILKPDQPQA